MQKYLLKGVGISGKFDQYFSVTTDEQPPADSGKPAIRRLLALSHTLLPLDFCSFLR